MPEHNIVILDGAPLKHLNLGLLRHRGALDGLLHFRRNRLFTFVKRHVNDVEVACLQQLEQETLLLAILIILEFVFNIE